jgi:hypothetical protein
VPARVFCETCQREVGAGHRLPEQHWLHRTTLLPVWMMEGAHNGLGAKSIEGVNTMAKGKAKSTAKKAVAKSTKVPPKAVGKAAAVKETPVERRKREMLEEKAAKAARR